MTSDRFRELYEQVQIPYLGDFMHLKFVELHQALDQIITETARINQRIDWVVARPSDTESHAN